MYEIKSKHNRCQISNIRCWGSGHRPRQPRRGPPGRRHLWLRPPRHLAAHPFAPPPSFYFLDLCANRLSLGAGYPGRVFENKATPEKRIRANPLPFFLDFVHEEKYVRGRIPARAEVYAFMSDYVTIKQNNTGEAITSKHALKGAHLSVRHLPGSWSPIKSYLSLLFCRLQCKFLIQNPTK